MRKKIRAELDALEAKDATLPWKTTRAEELLKLHTDSVNRDRPRREFLGWTPPENIKPGADGATRGLPLFIFNFAPIESHLGGDVRKRHTNLEKDGLISPTMDVVYDALGDLFFDVPILEVNPYLEDHDASAKKTLKLGWEDEEDTNLKNDLQVAILTYFYGDDGPTAIGCFGGEAAKWAADHISDGSKVWKNYKGTTLECVHPSIFRTTAPRAKDLMHDRIMAFGKLVEGVGGPSDAGEKLWAAKTQQGDYDQAMMEKLKREREANLFGGDNESTAQKKCHGPVKDRTQKAQDVCGPMKGRTQKAQDVMFGGINAPKPKHGRGCRKGRGGRAPTQATRFVGLPALVVPEGCVCRKCKNVFPRDLPATIKVRKWKSKSANGFSWECRISCPNCPSKTKCCGVKSDEHLNIIFEGQPEKLHIFKRNMHVRGKREIDAHKLQALPAEQQRLDNRQPLLQIAASPIPVPAKKEAEKKDAADKAAAEKAEADAKAAAEKEADAKAAADKAEADAKAAAERESTPEDCRGIASASERRIVIQKNRKKEKKRQRLE